MNQVTIYYALDDETIQLRNEAQSIGTLIKRGDLREIYSTLTREDISVFEEQLKRGHIDYDLVEYANDVNTPKVKRVRSYFEKEIPCLLYAEAGEDGLIQVSRLLKVMAESNDNNLKEHLMDEIKSTSFLFDNITALA